MDEKTLKKYDSGQIGVAMITHNAKHHLPNCIPQYLNSPLKPKVLLINSSSQDGTVELARELGAQTHIIPRKEFNHGTTRELARKLLNTEIVAMVTPDAYPLDKYTLEKLVDPLIKGKASVSYARQIPHHGAGILEAFPRQFNYPEVSQIRGLEDVSKYGVYTFFCSDSCAAYVNSTLDEIGGFRETLTAEDYFAVTRLLKRGYKIAYCAEAIVYHSHRYNLIQEFKRYFDTGLVRSQNRNLIDIAGKAEGRGSDYVKSLLKVLGEQDPLKIPYAILNSGMKWLGYRLGWHLARAPQWIKRGLSAQDYYWDSLAVRKG